MGSCTQCTQEESCMNTASVQTRTVKIVMAEKTTVFLCSYLNEMKFYYCLNKSFADQNKHHFSNDKKKV